MKASVWSSLDMFTAVTAAGAGAGGGGGAGAGNGFPPVIELNHDLPGVELVLDLFLDIVVVVEGGSVLFLWVFVLCFIGCVVLFCCAEDLQDKTVDRSVEKIAAVQLAASTNTVGVCFEVLGGGSSCKSLGGLLWHKI